MHEQKHQGSNDRKTFRSRKTSDAPITKTSNTLKKVHQNRAFCQILGFGVWQGVTPTPIGKEKTLQIQNQNTAWGSCSLQVAPFPPVGLPEGEDWVLSLTPWITPSRLEFFELLFGVQKNFESFQNQNQRLENFESFQNQNQRLKC